MKNWRELSLEKVCLKITDGAHSSPPSVPEGKPMASVKDLTSFGIRLESCRRIPDEDFKKLVKQGCQPMKGDVLIAKDGATALDTVCEVKRNEEVVLLSSVAILRPNPSIIDSSYLHYYLDASTTRSYLKGHFISGAAIPRVVLKDLKRAAVTVPPLPVQQRIAGILSAYDELIENSQRRIKILESMARALYREWFIHFRFPGHENHPRVASPLGEIPLGWDFTQLSALVDFAKGRKPAETRSEPMPGDVKLLLIDSLNGGTPVFTAPNKLVLADARDTLMVMDGSGSCHVSIGASGAVGSTLGRFRTTRPDVFSAHALFRFLEAKTEEFKSKNIGAAIPHANKDYILSQLIALPSVSIAQAFRDQIEPIQGSIEILKAKIQNLRRTRDLLLPRLLSGQIEVDAISEGVAA